MKSPIIRQYYIALNALKTIFRQPFSSLLSIFTLAATLSLPILLYLLVNSAEAWLGKTPIEPQISVFMELTAQTEDVQQVKIALEKNLLILRTEYINKDLALKQLEARGDLGDVMSALGENPLPDVFVVTPKAYDAASLKTLMAQLKALSMVETVQFDQAWIEKVRNSLSFAQGLTIFLALNFSLLLLLVSHNTIRMQVLSRHREIEVSALIGAPRGFIRLPFLYFAVWQALFSAGFACLFVTVLLNVIRPNLSAFAATFDTQIPLLGLDASTIVFLMLLTTLLSLLAAYWASNYHLARASGNIKINHRFKSA
ncbi:MAG: permease-like cell division protein FtsX [Neisseriaceae bacterium]|nr:permease-like cell division protein FtsX [Neisseriaceae bacterium]